MKLLCSISSRKIGAPSYYEKQLSKRLGKRVDQSLIHRGASLPQDDLCCCSSCCCRRCIVFVCKKKKFRFISRDLDGNWGYGDAVAGKSIEGDSVAQCMGRKCHEHDEWRSHAALALCMQEASLNELCPRTI